MKIERFEDIEAWPTVNLEPDNLSSYKESNLNPHSAFRIPHSTCGFTLLELLVVLVIIGIISALVGPKLVGSMQNVNLKTASKKISASLRYARSHAASKSTTYVALFDFDKDRLSITTTQETSDETMENHSGDDKGSAVASKEYYLPDGVKFEKAVSGEDEVDSGFFHIVFFPSGSSSGGEVILINEREKRYRINVDFITGAVQLSRFRN